MNNHEIRLLLEQAEIDNLSEPTLPEEEEYYNSALGDCQYKQGCEYLRIGNYEDAEDMFKKSIETYNNSYDEHCETPVQIYNPYIQLANCYILEGKIQDALKVCLKTLNVVKAFREFDSDNYYWPLEFDLYIKIAKLYVALDQEEMALYYHEKAVEHLNNR